MKSWNQRPIVRILLVVVLALGIVPFIPGTADAAQFTQAYVRLDRMIISNANTSGLVCADPSTAGAGTEAKVVIAFPSTYTVNTTAANWVSSVTDLPAGATAWPSIGATATTATSPANVVTFASGDLSADTLYCFRWTGTGTLTTAGSAANNQQAYVTTLTSGDVEIDRTNIALSNITNDQIVVTAVVPPTFVFALSGNTDTFSGNLDPATVMSTGGRTITITTNAKGGWIGWVRDSAQGLNSATANYTIATAGTVNGAPSTLTPGTEGFVLDADLTTDAGGGCTVAIDAEYNGTSTAMGGTFSGVFQPYAACTGAPPATANGDVVTLIERVAISGATPAGSDYTDTITVVAAGNF